MARVGIVKHREPFKQVFIYQRDPMDIYWGMTPLPHAIDIIRRELGDKGVNDLIKFVMACSHAAAVAEGSYWNGAVTEVYFFAIPNAKTSYEPYWGLIWKQKNNGTTFICSEVELPWLAEDMI